MLTGLNHITIAVNNLDRSLSFYTERLGLKPYVRWDKGAYLSLGDIWFCLSCDKAKPSQDYSHIAFSIAAADFDTMCVKLRAMNIVEWQQNHSEGCSLYILDPDGHKLEIHCGSLASRLAYLKTHPLKGIRWFKTPDG